MWNRKELKTKAKEALRCNYWRTVLISFISFVLLGTGGAFASGSSSGRSMISEENQEDLVPEEFIQPDVSIQSDENPFIMVNPQMSGFVIGLTIIAILFSILFLVFHILLDVFLYNPFRVGSKRFFIKNEFQEANVRETAYAFDHSYRNVVATMFSRDLHLILWLTLFVVPGIIKSYEYRMIPYILADNPEIPKKEAFLRSKEMMRGQKWKTFVLDLSFLGWNVLSVFTFGVLQIFYVSPYQCMTDAALYNCLSGNEKKEDILENAVIE